MSSSLKYRTYQHLAILLIILTLVESNPTGLDMLYKLVDCPHERLIFPLILTNHLLELLEDMVLIPLPHVLSRLIIQVHFDKDVVK